MDTETFREKAFIRHNISLKNFLAVGQEMPKIYMRKHVLVGSCNSSSRLAINEKIVWVGLLLVKKVSNAVIVCVRVSCSL